MTTTPLPEPAINTVSHGHFRVIGYTADQMHAYAAQCCAERDNAHIQRLYRIEEKVDALIADRDRLRAAAQQALEALNRVDAVERGMVTTKAHHYAAREETTTAIAALTAALESKND